MRFGIGALALACCAVFAWWPGVARATDCSGILSPCIDSDTFWPHAGPSRFQAVGGSDTVDPGQLGFGLVTSYLSRPIVVHLASPAPITGSPTGADAFVVDDQVNATFLWAYPISRRFELDLALPLTLGQSGTGLSSITGGAGLNDTAARDFRFGFTGALVRQRMGRSGAEIGVAGRFEVSAPTGDRDQFAGERSGVLVPSLTADLRAGRLFAAVEAGLRIRPTTEFLGARVGSQFTTAAGVGVDVLPRGLLSATLEAWELVTLVGQRDVVATNGVYSTQPGSGLLVPAEWQLSARSTPWANRDLSFQLGGGGGLGDSMTTPRFRFTLSVRWAPSARSRRKAVAADQ